MFTSDPQISLVFGDYYEYNQSTGQSLIISNKNLPTVLCSRDFFDLFANGKITWNHNAIVYKRIPAIALGFYWHPEILRNDWESFLRLIAGSRVGYLNSIESAWVHHGANETRKPNLQKYMNNYIMIDGVARHAEPILGHAFILNWKHRMYALKTRTSSIGYITSGDLPGLFTFIKAVFKIDGLLATRTILDPYVLIRLLLSTNPRLYLAVKRLFRRLSK